MPSSICRESLKIFFFNGDKDDGLIIFSHALL